MSEKNSRHPIKNFFIKRSIQFRVISKIFLVVFLAGLLTIGILVYFYNSKSRTGSLYYMSDKVVDDLVTQSYLGIVLPPIIAVEVVAICIAFGIGLISSRKIAVPLYKMEKWATKIKTGNLKTKLAFRTEDRLKELTSQCNGATDFYRSIFSEIKTEVETITQHPDNQATVNKSATALKQILERIEF